MGEAQRQNQGRCVTMDGKGREEGEADHPEGDSQAYIGRMWGRPTRTVWHPRPGWATRNVDGWQTTFSEFLDGKPTSTNDPTVGLQGATQAAPATCPPDTSPALAPLDQPPLLAARYPKKEPRPPLPQEGWLRPQAPPQRPEQTRESVGLNILGPRPVREGEVESAKEECPASLTRAQPLGRTDIFEILVIRPDQEGLRRPLQPVTPLTQGQSYRQQLSIADVIVTFCRAQTTREECTRVHLPIAEGTLR